MVYDGAFIAEAFSGTFYSAETNKKENSQKKISFLLFFIKRREKKG
jgi:hypothetical protein